MCVCGVSCVRACLCLCACLCVFTTMCSFVCMGRVCLLSCVHHCLPPSVCFHNTFCLVIRVSGHPPASSQADISTTVGICSRAGLPLPPSLRGPLPVTDSSLAAAQLSSHRPHPAWESSPPGHGVRPPRLARRTPNTPLNKETVALPASDPGLIHSYMIHCTVPRLPR